MDVRLLSAVILVYDTRGQEVNCGLLEAAKGVKNGNKKILKIINVVYFFKQTRFLISNISQKRSVDAYDHGVSGDRFWALLARQKRVCLK